MRIRKGLSNSILLVLEKAIDGYVRLDDLIHHSGRYAYGDGWDKLLSKSALAQAIKRLREGGLIEFIDEEKLLIRLTDLGKDQAMWAAMKIEEGSWDGKWRIVIWDIPEKKRAARDLFRRKLKELGFNHWQKSVWATKKNCTKQLRDFVKKVGIEDWIMVIESDNIGKHLS